MSTGEEVGAADGFDAIDAVVGQNITYARRFGQHRISDAKRTDLALLLRTDGQRTGNLSH